MTTETQVRGQVKGSLATIRPLVTMSREGLVIGALEWGVAREPAYETATAAASKGDLELLESGGGIVGAIEAVTKAKPVVIFAGDTVVGGKQNRIINVTVWLAAMSRTQLPVSCLEAHRWDQGHRFATSRKTDYLLRAQMSAQLAEVAAMEAEPRDGPAGMREPMARERRRSYAAHQGAVWAEISEKEARFGARSPSAALHDLYAREAEDLATMVRAFPCPAGATGIAVAIGGKLVAVELFDAPSTLAEQWPRLVEGAASAWADHRRAVAAGAEPAPRHQHPDDGALGRMLARAGAGLDRAIVGPSVGEGFDLRLAGSRVRGGALVVGDDVVHLELFRAEA